MSNLTIRSTPAHLIVQLPRKIQVRWLKGSHTAEVYASDNLYAHDVFTFAFEKNRTSMLDFTESLQNWLEYRAD